MCIHPASAVRLGPSHWSECLGWIARRNSDNIGIHAHGRSVNKSYSTSLVIGAYLSSHMCGNHHNCPRECDPLLATQALIPPNVWQLKIAQRIYVLELSLNPDSLPSCNLPSITSRVVTTSCQANGSRCDGPDGQQDFLPIRRHCTRSSTN